MKFLQCFGSVTCRCRRHAIVQRPQPRQVKLSKIKPECDLSATQSYMQRPLLANPVDFTASFYVCRHGSMSNVFFFVSVKIRRLTRLPLIEIILRRLFHLCHDKTTTYPSTLTETNSISNTSWKPFKFLTHPQKEHRSFFDFSRPENKCFTAGHPSWTKKKNCIRCLIRYTKSGGLKT